MKRKYGQEPWFKSVRGNVTAYLSCHLNRDIAQGRSKFAEGVPAQNDPVPALANLEVPQLWTLGGQDPMRPLERPSVARLCCESLVVRSHRRLSRC